MPARRNIKKEKQVIPILFTLGIIAWGFFAIDRLTSQKDTGGRLEKKFHNLEKKKIGIKEVSFVKKNYRMASFRIIAIRTFS